MCVPSAWQIRRSEFNHDWLSNKYLNSLGAFLRRVAQHDADVERLHEFIKEDLPQWHGNRPVAVGLVQSFETEMSPRSLLRRAPLACLDEGTKEWLGPLVHELWLARLRVMQLAADALMSIERVDSVYEDLCNELGRMEPTPQALKDLAPSFLALQDALVAMSAAFSRFPQRIRAA